MDYQKTFTKAYANKLKENVGDNIDRYASDTFAIDNSHVLIYPNLEHPSGLLQKMMDAKNDAEAAIALYEAYKGLTPLHASLETLWIYLAHTELFSYVQKRWNNVMQDGVSKQYILDHWFFAHGLVRNALSGLWWAVYCTIDENNEDDPYIYTRFYLSNYTLRVVRLGPTKLIRHKEAVFGIMQYLIDTKDSKEATNSMEDRVNFVVSHFNKMGATKQLVYLDRMFFYNELEKVKDELLIFHHKKTKEEEDIELEDT